MLNLADIISKLQSDKVKARQEALGLLEEAFVANKALINALGTNTKEWLAIFRALFAAVHMEKATCAKKGFDNATPASLARLEKAGSIVRNITAHCVPLLTKKVVRELLNHLAETMVHRGRLVSSLSLNYVKTILELCSHRPHLEHFTTDMWICLTSLAFAAILGDNLSPPRGFGDESDDTFDVEEYQTASCSDASPGSRKRRRSDSPPAQRPPSVLPSQPSYTASPEQIDLMTLLVVLLRSPYAPFSAPSVSQRILNRLHCFFVKYSTWGNAHHAAVVATNVVLDQTELNLKRSVTDFALKMWPLLLSHWALTRKSKAAKEDITLIMTTLLPFITLPEIAEVAKNDVRERVDDLYSCLDEDLRHSSGFEGLSLESLQLRLRRSDAGKGIFDAATFRSGFAFGPSQALSWTTLELHADCIQALHIYSERFGSPVKRRKIETPLSDILLSIKNTTTSSKIRSHQLQVLLFVIDRHWAIFHESLQQEISSALIEVLAFEDPLVQSWTFLCLAAITFTDDTITSEIDWYAIWSHSVRRTNVLNVCRGASHAAHVLLSSKRLPVHRVLADIEAFSSDLVVQGPTFPYDSVCAFLCDCLLIASQDMRLHRVKLPDKVLSWISENWTMSSPLRSTMPSHSVSDVLELLETTCGFSKRSQIPCRFVFPDSVVVEAATERHRTAGIRRFVLHSGLPTFHSPTSLSSQPTTPGNLFFDPGHLSPPSPREVKVSNFLFKYLDLLCVDWQNIKDLTLDSKPEKIRRSLDAAVISLCLQASMMRNGSQNTRRVVQLACKLVEVITPCLELPRWNANERALILMGLEPLVSEEETPREDDPWDLMPGPDVGSGLKRSTLVKLAGTSRSNKLASLTPRRELQRLIWQSVDVQNTFEGVMKALRNTLKVISKTGPLQDEAKVLDQDEGFAMAAVVPKTSLQDSGRVCQLCIQLCMNFLASAPILQSGTFSPTRDKDLTEFMLNCEPQAFLVLAPEFFQVVRKQQLHLSISTAERFKNRIHDLLTNSYDFARGVAAQMQAIQFLHSTSHIWMQPNVFTSDLADGVRLLNAWFSTMILEGNLRSWRVRDRLICFLDYHGTIDPLETFWRISGSAYNEDVLLEIGQLPSRILPKMADDEDTRVRFRVAVANARLLSKTNNTHEDLKDIYSRVNSELSTNTDQIEHMLSRFVHLGNAMISSAAMRRGAYWHLLEITLFIPAYNDAVCAVLSAVADRLGLPDLRSLSETYASQLVESLIKADKDFFGFPHSLLGYKDRRQCAITTFPLLAPLILQAGGDSPETDIRRGLFEDHCNKAQKSLSQGLLDCFADIVGTRIVYWIDRHYDDVQGLTATSSQALLYQIYQFAVEADDSVEPKTYLRRYLDRIIFTIIATVADIDHSNNGDIVKALRTEGGSERVALIWAALTSYRKPEDFKMHHPNFPAFSTLTVLRSLAWLSQEFSEVFTTPVIYHVLHHLFAAIGRSMLVNEQMRLLHVLSLWISINGSFFRDVTLLRTLMLGAIILLGECDLAHFAQGILQWTFHHYASLNSPEPYFPDLLGRIARISHDYSRETDDPILIGLGNELLDWIEKQALELSNVDQIKEQILKALSLWPRNPSGLLAQLSQKLHESQPVSDILQNQHVTSGKFRLARRLRHLAESELYSHDKFCGQDFWNLKSCIPSQEEIQLEDIDAFVDVLFKYAGQIKPLQDGIESSRSVSKLHQEASRKPRSGQKLTFKAASPKHSIVLSLLDILLADTPTQINRAYNTLRLIFALSIPDLADPQDWPSTFNTEISYLSTFPLPIVAVLARSLEELNSPNLAASADFPRWVCQISLLLNEVLASDDSFYAQLSSLIQFDSSFAAQILPVLVHGVLLSGKNGARTMLSDYFRSILLEDGGSLSSRKKMVVEVVLHLRHFVPSAGEAVDPLAYDKWLDIDFRLLSRGAMSCGAYTTALLFLELAADYSKSSPDTDSITEEILYEIYSHIEEPDGFYAIKSNDVRGFLTRRFHHEGQWDKAFQFHGANFAAEFQGTRGVGGIIQSLHSNGLDHLAMSVLHSSNAETKATANSSELGYEVAWRTEQWDLPDPPANRSFSLYRILRAVHRDRDPHGVDIHLRNALSQAMSHLHRTGIEDMVGIRDRARTLLCLREIKKWRSEEIQGRIAAQDVTRITWSDFVDISPEFDFTTLESIIATRMSLLRSTIQREQREQIGDMETPFVSGLKALERLCLIRLSRAARLSGNHQMALNAIIHAQRLGRNPTFDVSQEFANVLWLQKEHKLAVEYLRILVPSSAQLGADYEEITKNARILSQLGTWSAEACLQKPTDIREQYFHRATTSILGSEGHEASLSMGPALAVVFHQYALFAEEQYHAILRSPEVERLKLYVERKKHEIEQIKESMGRTQSNTPHYKQLSQYQKKAEAIYGEDVVQFSVHTETRSTFLVQAIEMYSRCLQASDEFDDSAVIRLCSLWFANFNDDQMPLNFSRAIERVPSRKFIFLAHQLSARLSKPEASADLPENQKYLQTLILRMCNEHPFHSLYQVWALQESSPDSSRRQSIRAEGVAPHNGRAQAAADILAICRLQQQSSERVVAIEYLCKAYLEWAKYPLKDKYKTLAKTDVKQVPTSLLLRKISKLPVPVTTIYTPLDHSLRYDNIVTIVRYSTNFNLAGGNNLPKISECIGSDGRKYKQLFKGEGDDDLRQDAVMEQVFELVNVVLKRDRQTRKRQLSVRCYKVIPLAPQAGLLEFVQNTMPIGQWLSPAHKRYRPQDIEPAACSTTLAKYRQRNPVVEDPVYLRDLFLGLLKRFQPVFRHFFTERNKLPIAWFTTRLNYARSAATTSIVGHVLGLGDRHVSNILIDKSTGELVHIDLGIAFDQGKRLPIPELVPFRLTGDMVDGLGTAGTEGVFRRCAEETLRVLRNESGVITTVLEVFRHDPLHSWTASAIKIQRIQGAASSGAPGGSTASHAHTGRFGFGLEIDMESDSVDESADRALTSVHRKLDRALSVEYTVNELIVSATDPTNLSQIFFGWSPFL